jgi:hypothetical protein
MVPFWEIEAILRVICPPRRWTIEVLRHEDRSCTVIAWQICDGRVRRQLRADVPAEADRAVVERLAADLADAWAAISADTAGVVDVTEAEADAIDSSP